MYTPEFFVLNKDRKIVYMGAMDDKSNAVDVKVNYLAKALEAAFAGKPAAKGENGAYWLQDTIRANEGEMSNHANCLRPATRAVF